MELDKSNSPKDGSNNGGELENCSSNLGGDSQTMQVQESMLSERIKDDECDHYHLEGFKKKKRNRTKGKVIWNLS